MPWNRKLYPADWPSIRASIQKRAGNCCERCWVPNYAVGYRDEFGCFQPAGGWGSELFDRAGAGELPFKEAQECARRLNECRFSLDGTWRRWFVIVCTTAHLNHNTQDNRTENLSFRCQKDHLDHDREMHQRVRRYRREKDQLKLLEVMHGKGKAGMESDGPGEAGGEGGESSSLEGRGCERLRQARPSAEDVSTRRL